MIPFNYRFHGHNSLNYVYRRGKTERSASLTFKFIPNRQRLKSRAAVVVSKKISKSAVKRNRIRRRIYGILNQQIKNFRYPIDLVIIVNNVEIDNLTHQELENKLQNFLSAIKVV